MGYREVWTPDKDDYVTCDSFWGSESDNYLPFLEKAMFQVHSVPTGRFDATVTLKLGEFQFRVDSADVREHEGTVKQAGIEYERCVREFAKLKADSDKEYLSNRISNTQFNLMRLKEEYRKAYGENWEFNEKA